MSDTTTTPELWWRTPATWGAVIVILHVVGVTGTALGYADMLLPLTPLNLVVCAAIVMSFTGDESPWRWSLTMFLGFAIEVLGVATGWLFGDYSYGSGLGPKALEVPLADGCFVVAAAVGDAPLGRALVDFEWTDRVSVCSGSRRGNLDDGT